MKTKYDIGDKVVLVAVVKGVQMYSNDKCPLYTLKVYDTSEYNGEVHLNETVLDKMNSRPRCMESEVEE